MLNFQTLHFTAGNDLPFILFLPSYTATAWYHGRLHERLQADLRATLAEVEEFARGEYASALMLGDDLPAERQRALARQLAEYTGLSVDYIARTNLRVNIYRFVKQLLREQRRTVGRLDSRFTGIDRDAAGELAEFDPSYAAIQGPYSATLNDYVRTELGFESDLPYEILTDRVHPWKFDQHHNQYVNVAETLRQAMSVNPHLRVYVANGYYDLATPYWATHYTFSHMALDPVLRANVTMDHFKAGHMMYVQQRSLSKLNKALAAFVGPA
ncbi:MAG: hypothetical protein R3300_21710 [Candidatus Promineifilaceae bacterium]|nr:hypothetical protein [Candidatus Promineifilaceae bacterium]